MERYADFLKQAPDPEAAGIRLERMLNDEYIRRHVEKMPDDMLRIFIHLISLSDFFYRFFCRHPQSITLIDGAQDMDRRKLDAATDIDALRLFKYEELLKVAWLDLVNREPYQIILERLSILADAVIIKAMQLTAKDAYSSPNNHQNIPFCVFAMGKLGANELNFSSDVDLVFVSKNIDDIDGDVHIYLEEVIEHIRWFSRIMQDVSEDGFLYRVDLKLRPWGRSGPLIISVDETEHYYEASTEAWERFAWLRARILAGDRLAGEDLLQRLEPFIYLRTLSSDDLNRFVQIKHDMHEQRKKPGSWNVKLGEGGIRDIEFFIQMLQLVNAHGHPSLKATNTLVVLEQLISLGFLSNEEGREIGDAYLFLRRLENRLQMVDERQTHQLPDDPGQRKKIASSLGYGDSSDDGTLGRFNEQLARHKITAKSCFERILPGES